MAGRKTAKQADLLEEAGIEMERRPPPARTVACEECGKDFPKSRCRRYPDAFPEPGRRKPAMYLCRDCQKALQAWAGENLPGISQGRTDCSG